MKITSKHLVIVSMLLTALIAAAAFVPSFTALRDLAAHHGVPDNLAVLFPLLADAVVIAASMSVISRQMDGLRPYYQMALVGLFTLLSVALNAWHAITQTAYDPLPIVVAVIPPVALFLTFELLSGQLQKLIERHALTETFAQLQAKIAQAQRGLDDFLRTGQAQKEALSADIETLTRQRDQFRMDTDAERAQVTADLDRLKAERRALKRESKADKADMPTEPQDNHAGMPIPRAVRLDLIARDVRTANGHGAPSAADIAAKYGISDRQARRDLADVLGQMQTAETN